MCGIMGYYAFGVSRPEKQELEKMFADLSRRGTDACGWAYKCPDGSIKVTKAPISSRIMVNCAEWKKEVFDMPYAIFHTRAATQGNKTNNMNNHPLYNKKGFCLVHNGIIYNDKMLRRQYHFDAEVDSEAVLQVYSAGKKKNIKRVESVFDEVSGSYAVAIISRKDDELVLFRHDNPITVGYDEAKDILYFASGPDYIADNVKCERKYMRGISLGSLHEIDLSNDKAMIINKDGIVTTKTMVSKTSYSSFDRDDWGYGYNSCHNRYGSDAYGSRYGNPYTNTFTRVDATTGKKEFCRYDPVTGKVKVIEWDNEQQKFVYVDTKQESDVAEEDYYECQMCKKKVMSKDLKVVDDEELLDEMIYNEICPECAGKT